MSGEEQFSTMTGLQRRFANLAVPGTNQPLASTSIMQGPDDPPVTAMSPEKPASSGRQYSRKQRAKLRSIVRELSQLKIEGISFGLYSTDEIDAQAVVNVTNPDEYGNGTIRDLRMGPHHNGENCQTCGQDILSCNGHIGKIVIPMLPNPLTRSKLILVLSCVCNSCGELLVTEDQLRRENILRLKGNNRLQAIKELVTKLHRQCQRVTRPEDKPCQPMPEYVSPRNNKDDYWLNYKYSGEDEVFERTPREIAMILNAISEEDARLLGFAYDNHPRNMIMERLIVIPYCARPDTYQGEAPFSDDLSTMYRDILHTLKDYNESGEDSDKQQALKNLYFKISHFMKNNDDKYRQGGSRPYSDVARRIQGKTAIIRGMIMGKRVDEAGRTVVGPAAYLRVDEIGVPRLMAARLSRPIRVTEMNRAELQSMLNDTNRILGITMFEGPDAGVRMTVQDHFKRKYPNYSLRFGDIVDRTLQDGDIILVNRAPTLHKQNILAVKTRLIDDKIVRINLSITTPLNADFDGDEVNIHVPQTIEAYAEAEILLSVHQNLMNGQTNKPMMGIVYDSLNGVYQLTFPGYIVDKIEKEIPKIQQDMLKHAPDSEEYQKLAESLTQKENLKDQYQAKLMIDPVVFNQAIEPVVGSAQFETLRERLQKYNVPYGSGRSLFSSALPENFYYHDKGIVIKEGILISGLIEKGTVGPGGNIINEMIWQLGSKVTVDFMSDIQFVIREYLQQTGFSAGIDDCLPGGEEIRQLIDKEVDTALLKVQAISGKTTNQIIAQQRERKIGEKLNVLKGIGNKLVRDVLQPENALIIMADSGAKGSSYHTTQMSSLLGQQSVSGERIPANLPGNRSLPIFEPGTDDPRARGFCVNSFGTGLDPAEFWFHAQGGREGLTDTAINTAKTGFLQHQIIKSAEDIHISPDGSVRTDDNSIVQFVYGGDGFDSNHLGNVKIKGSSVPFYRNIEQLANRINSKYSQ